MPNPGANTTVAIEGKTLTLSNLGKVLYPESGFTKAQILDYYLRIAPVLIPHLRARPLTMKRYPEGVTGNFFYEKNCPKYRPPWVPTAPIPRTENGANIDYCVVNDIPTLLWAINLAALELHTSLSLAKSIDRPTMIVFDLDPGPPADILTCCQVALHLKSILDSLNLQSFPKTSGSKGLQLYVPLNTPTTYAETKPFAHALAQLLERQRPDLIVSRMTKSLRPNKVLIDWSQNDAKKTTICAYSLRARPTPTVSTPITWQELTTALHSQNPQALQFTAPTVLSRIPTHADLFSPLLTLKQKLPKPSPFTPSRR